MAMVPGRRYVNDVFISYAHSSNLLRPGIDKGWVTQFIEDLEVLLIWELGRSRVRIWWDEKLNGIDDFNDVIKKELCQSALLLCILTADYLDSAPCMEELETFLRSHLHETTIAGPILASSRFCSSTCRQRRNL